MTTMNLTGSYSECESSAFAFQQTLAKAELSHSEILHARYLSKLMWSSTSIGSSFLYFPLDLPDQKLHLISEY
jgi:hypothetical protein